MPDEAATYTHQVLDHQAVFRPITRASFRLSAESADVIADKAVAIATTTRCGPVHIDVPIGVADTATADRDLPQWVPAAPVAPSGKALVEARGWLAAAERPIAVVGLDVLYDRSEVSLAAFLEKHSIPFITTYKAKGVLREDHPLCLGAAGLSPKADGHLLPLVAQADLVLAIGYDPIEMRVGWRDPWDPVRQQVIDITAEPNTHYMHQSTLNFVADSGATLDALSESVSARETWPGGEPTAVKADLAQAFAADEAWGPSAVIDECRAVLPDGTLASVDSGAHRILLSQLWQCDAPRSLIQSTGLCTMGCAVPMAIGMKLAQPERPVVGFTGDAGMLMVAGELSTAAELGLAPMFVVFVDASLALIELKQRQRQLRNAGVDFGHHDFAALGRALGGAGETVRSRAELREALERAMAAETFTVIAAEIDRESYNGRF